MSYVAVAGGTGGLGRSIVDAIIDADKYEVFVLSRQINKVFDSYPRVKILVVDYNSVSELANILRSNGIHTIISALGITDEQSGRAQYNLIDAAIQSNTVKRFTPSEFGIDYVEANKQGFGFPFPRICQIKANTAELLQSSSLLYTRYICGAFMDYLGFPHAPTYLPPIAILADVENCVASITGNGETLVVFTHTKDVGRFVAASLDLNVWPEKSYIVGDKVSSNQLVEMAEKIRGKKFTIHHESLDHLRSGQQVPAELPANIPRYEYMSKELVDGLLSSFGIGFATGWFDFPGETLNQRFPHVQTLGLEEFLARYWKDQ